MIKKYIQYIKENIDDLEEEDEEDLDDSFITDGEFRQFLIDNDCLDEYVENVENYNVKYPKHEQKEVLEKLFREKLKNTYVNGAFDWASTPQGLHFWCNIHDKWLIKINYFKN